MRVLEENEELWLGSVSVQVVAVPGRRVFVSFSWFPQQSVTCVVCELVSNFINAADTQISRKFYYSGTVRLLTFKCRFDKINWNY